MLFTRFDSNWSRIYKYPFSLPEALASIKILAPNVACSLWFCHVYYKMLLLTDGMICQHPRPSQFAHICNPVWTCIIFPPPGASKKNEKMKTLSIAVLQAQSQGVFQAFSGLYCPVEYGLANVFSAVFDPLLFKFHLRMSKSDAELRDVFAFQCDCGRSWQRSSVCSPSG